MLLLLFTLSLLLRCKQSNFLHTYTQSAKKWGAPQRDVTLFTLRLVRREGRERVRGREGEREGEREIKKKIPGDERKDGGEGRSERGDSRR